MQQNGYDLHWYETVFEKFASTLAFRGFWNNNWYAAESSTMVFAALNLENRQKQDYYLQFILSKDTINGGCGQLALPSTVKNWLTPDGHWKEPGGYHNYPVGNLLVASLALEKNGHDVFKQFPALFKASYAMLKYSFPNLTVGGFGDTGRASQSAESLEIGLIGAVKYKDPILPDMLASMNKLIEGGKYKREDSGFLGLLTFLPPPSCHHQRFSLAAYRNARLRTLFCPAKWNRSANRDDDRSPGRHLQPQPLQRHGHGTVRTRRGSWYRCRNRSQLRTSAAPQLLQSVGRAQHSSSCRILLFGPIQRCGRY